MLFVILDLHSACIYGVGLSILKILVSELTRISGFVRLKDSNPHAVKHQILRSDDRYQLHHSRIGIVCKGNAFL